MKSWQEKCAIIIEFLESFFPEVQYRIVFRKDKLQGWFFIVETVRNDKGVHQGTVIDSLMVISADLEQLPDKMLDKAKKAVLDWQTAGLDHVRKLASQLEQSKSDLEKRMNASVAVGCLEQEVKNAQN